MEPHRAKAPPFPSMPPPPHLCYQLVLWRHSNSHLILRLRSSLGHLPTPFFHPVCSSHAHRHHAWPLRRIPSHLFHLYPLSPTLPSSSRRRHRYSSQLRRPPHSRRHCSAARSAQLPPNPNPARTLASDSPHPRSFPPPNASAAASD